MNLIDVSKLYVRYGVHEVLSDISFSVAPGDFLAVVGPNGSGKTTLIKTLVGLIPPYSGSILLKGVPLAQTQGLIGYLPQKSSFADPRFPATVREVVYSGLTMKKGRVQHSRDTTSDTAIEHVLRMLQIESLVNTRVGRLSGGQQQRVHLARALVGNPALLILDEPTGALDPHTRECFYTTLQKHNKELGVTIIIVTHDSHSIGTYADTILFLDRKLLFSGSMEEFHQAPSSGHYFDHHHIPGGSPC